ncbi:MAG: MFS transporter [Marinosulfonomonas sp.]|nr:MFS transporter [Marinosulfonomonas sp.]
MMNSSDVSGRGTWHTAITFVLIATTFLGAVVATGGYMVPALAIATKQALGVDAAFIGYQVTLVFGFGGVSSLISGGYVGRFGPCRVLQAALVVGAAGCLLYTASNLVVLTFGSIVLGCSYGMTYPAASVLLSRFGKPERLNFLYSFRQASTALGAVVAGLIGPFIAILWGWQGAFYAVAALGLFLTIAINGLRPYWDDLADRSFPISAPWAGVRIIISNKSLFMLCFVGFGFSAVQVGVLAFLVLFLAEEVGFSLAEGGMALSLINILGASSRMFWGWRADLLKNSLVVVSTMGIVTAVVIAVFSFANPEWPSWMIFSVLSCFGMATFGWSGIVMANIASRADPDKIAETVGGALGFMFSGAWVGPSIGAVILQVSGNYRYVFTFLCVTALIAAAMAVRVSFQNS